MPAAPLLRALQGLLQRTGCLQDLGSRTTGEHPWFWQFGIEVEQPQQLEATGRAVCGAGYELQLGLQYASSKPLTVKS